jgi:hypothetical protein
LVSNADLYGPLTQMGKGDERAAVSVRDGHVVAGDRGDPLPQP